MGAEEEEYEGAPDQLADKLADLDEELAEQRASVPEELKRLLAGAGVPMPGNGLAGQEPAPVAPVYTTEG